MKKFALLPIMSFILLFAVNVNAQSTSSEGEANQNTTRANKVSGQFQMINPGRKLLQAPDWTQTKVDTPCKVSLILIVDQNGKVLSASPVTSKTTTSDPAVVNVAIEKVKSDARYEAKAGTSSEKVPYEFYLSAE